jgi:hypothetical protein
MPHIQGNNLERSQFDALICKFERTSSPDYQDDFVTISIAFQRPPPMVSLFRSNPAVEMVTQLARGLRDLLEDPPELQEISVVKTSAWVKDKYVAALRCCSLDALTQSTDVALIQRTPLLRAVQPALFADLPSAPPLPHVR